jgi:hypothetical protein
MRRLGQFFLGHIQIRHIGSMMFLMMQLHDVSADGGLECIKVVRQVGQRVLRAHA